MAEQPKSYCSECEVRGPEHRGPCDDEGSLAKPTELPISGEIEGLFQRIDQEIGRQMVERGDMLTYGEPDQLLIDCRRALSDNATALSILQREVAERDEDLTLAAMRFAMLAAGYPVDECEAWAAEADPAGGAGTAWRKLEQSSADALLQQKEGCGNG